MKVKIFEAATAGVMEEFVNQWLAENAGVKIERILQSEAGFASPNVTISIWYEPKVEAEGPGVVGLHEWHVTACGGAGELFLTCMHCGEVATVPDPTAEEWAAAGEVRSGEKVSFRWPRSWANLERIAYVGGKRCLDGSDINEV